MVFSSLIFLYAFLPLCLLLYFFKRDIRYRNIVLLLFSLVFYAWGEPVFVVLLIFSATVDYVNGRLVDKYRGRPGAKLALLSSLFINLGLLAGFKYSGFAVENINTIFNTAFTVPKIMLPIGISFYTFQTLSYIIDVYRGKVAVQKTYSNYLMYVSLFPQLVAGPIVRYSDINDEILERTSTLEDVSYGITRFCAGLAKKVLIANTAGALATKYLDGNLAELPVASAWFGIIMFSLQIYYDFSGYSDMGIGLGRIFGFHFYENFAHPYISRSATEFWRRWHISLGGFFRDYVYIPLGGNRKHMYLNLLIVWFLTGLWHGASWNFILWGLYFGLFIALEKKFLGKILYKLPKIFSHAYLIFIAVVGWAIFYFTDISRLGEFFKILFFASSNPLTNGTLSTIVLNNIFFIIIAIIGCMPIAPILDKHFTSRGKSYAPALVSMTQLIVCILFLTISTAMLVGASYNPFLYFRF